MQNFHDLRGQLDILVPFEALLETQSVTLAAERIGITQSAMSRILERLRCLFDDPLLVRSGAGMDLTPRAQTLRTPLREALSAAAALYAPIEFDPKQATRTFRAIIPDVVAAPLLPALLERLRKDAPNCRLHLAPWRDKLETGEDIDFIVSTELALFRTFRTELLFQDRDVLVFRNAPPRGRDVLELDHVAVVPAGLGEDPVDAWLRQEGLSRRIAATVPHYLLALHLVARGGYYAIMPSRTATALGNVLGISAADLAIDQEPDQQWLIYPPRLEYDPASSWLCALVMDVCRKPKTLARGIVGNR